MDRRSDSSGPGLPIAWLQLVALWALAIALPLLQLYDESPEFLVARGNGWPGLPIFTVLLLAGPPTLMVALEWAARRLGLGQPLHLTFVGLLVAALAVQMLKEQFDPESRLLTIAALLIGAAFAFLYTRGRFLGSLLTLLSPAALAIGVWFLAFSSAASLAWPSGSPDVKSTPVGNPVPVVAVIMDELSLASLTRDGEIDPRRYPGFARLARSSTWYRNASTVVDNTVRAVPAIMSGHLGDRSDAPVAEDYPGNIFRRLDGQYEMHVQEPITNLCDVCPSSKAPWPTRLRRLIASSRTIVRQRLAPGKPPEFLGLPSETIEDRPEHFREWVSGIEGGRTLNLAHLELPHEPYHYDASGRRYTRAIGMPGLNGEQWADDPPAVADGERRYLDQLTFVDRLLAEMIDELERRGLWDRALVVVTADHGVAFVPDHSRRNVETANVGEVGAVPLFIKAPGQKAGKISAAPARTTDILPTIGDYLGADWPGQSLRDPLRRSQVVVQGQFGPTVRMALPAFELRREAAARRIAAAQG